MTGATTLLAVAVALAAGESAPTLAVEGSAADSAREPRTGVEFPRRAEGLDLAGVGVRTKLFVKVYAAALYLDSAGAGVALREFRGRTAEELAGSEVFYDLLMTSDFDRALQMHFVYNAGARRVVQAFRDGIEANLPGWSAAADAFLALFPDTVGADGDLLRVHTGSEGLIVVTHNGTRLGEVRDPALARALWAVWFGPDPISRTLKRDLVQGVPELLR